MEIGKLPKEQRTSCNRNTKIKPLRTRSLQARFSLRLETGLKEENRAGQNSCEPVEEANTTRLRMRVDHERFGDVLEIRKLNTEELWLSNKAFYRKWQVK